MYVGSRSLSDLETSPLCASYGSPRQFFKACFQPPLHISVIYQYNEAVSARLGDLRAKANIKLFEKGDDKEQISETGSTSR